MEAEIPLLGSPNPEQNTTDQDDPTPVIETASATTSERKEPVQRSQMHRQLVALADVHRMAAGDVSVLQIVPAVGGCGVTTVVATLGRALSILGDRVLLVDARSSSTLASFYNAQAQGSSLFCSTVPSSRFEGTVHVLRSGSSAQPMGHSADTRFHRAVAELGGCLDRVLVGSNDLSTPSAEAHREATKAKTLIIITPELRSALAAPSILESTKNDADVFFLLNRFDGENSRHNQFRLQLQHSLGARLLPFCIPDSSYVEDAILRGVTVLDQSPESDIADAFFDLAEWYRSNCETASWVRTSKETQVAV